MTRTVLQVLPRLVTGGVERGTVEITAALVANGWRAIVVSAGGPMADEVKRVGSKHITFPLASKNPLKMRKNIDNIADVINAFDVNIVHARSRAPAWSAYYAARQTGCHFMTTFHNAYGGAHFPPKRFYNSIMARGERVIAISNFVGAHVKEIYGVGDDRLRIIPRGVDVARFDPAIIDKERVEKLRQEWQIPEGRSTIMLPGRLTRWKGQDVLIDALTRLRRSNVFCLLIGSGDADYRKQLEEKIAQQNLGDAVRITGECRDMPAALRLADIVVSASTRPEGFGRVIVEAQAMGCLTIATQHGGAEESIKPGETGWLTPPGDATALAAALAHALDLPPEEKKAVSENARAHVRKHFTTAQMCIATLAVYDELLKVDLQAEEVLVPDAPVIAPNG